jgi:tripartite-type tricarboxylate transporter receptor subunit TctC
MDRRTLVTGSIAGAAATALPGFAVGQDAFPSRPISIINAFPPGGSSDLVIRPFAAALEPIIRQPVVIETKPGAAGAVGAQVAAAAKPDGYTLLVHLVSLSGFAEVDRLYGRPVKFTLDDFVPIARFISDPLVLITSSATPYKSLKDLVEDARKRPDQVIFSSSGLHGAAHLPMALLLKTAGVRMRHLPTPGGGPAITAMLGNNSQATVVSFAGASTHLASGKARALACFGDKRVRAFPDVPTAKEQGFDVEFYMWVGLFAPKATPEPVVAKLRTEAKKAITSAPFEQAMRKLNQDIAYLDQPEFRSFLGVDSKRVVEAVRIIGKV